MHERNVVSGLTEAQSRLPRFPEGGPPGGPRIRDLAARAVAVLALTATAVYLGWRAVATIDPAVWWVSIPLHVLELHAALGLGLYTPGLYFAGLAFQYAFASMLVGGAGRDAEYVIRHLCARPRVDRASERLLRTA